MSPAPRVILLDSCAYFRLARSIHPLLAESFGTPPRYSLFVLAVLDDEYLTSSRLRNKFEWVNEKRYVEDRRKKRYASKGKWAPKADTAFSFLAGYVKHHGLLVAPEDLKALAVGFVRDIPVVTDDRNCRQVADAHGIRCWGTLDLLKLMVDCGRITVGKAREVLLYWDHENDLPMAKPETRKRYADLFGEHCPI
ncbi:MAG: hypothetical protein JXR37_06890 [Kiritimatiellae bacterium]|nr:hypothetical protein [Kiritimatiellia bacterium]